MRAKEYVEEVMRHVEAEEPVKSRLAKDLLEHINDAGGEPAIGRMGDPKELAAELMDSLYSDKTEVIRELVRAKAALRRYRFDYEYVSKRKLFGMPLVHIRCKPEKPMKPAVGIVAIGLNAVGVLSFGLFSFGLLSFGVLALGLLLAFGSFAAGGLAFGAVAAGLMAFGGVAVGLVTYGGASIGYFHAVGGYAKSAHVAAGGYAVGNVAIGGTAEGTYTIATGGTSLDVGAVTKAEARALIEQAYPQIRQGWLRFMTWFFSA